MNRPSPRNVRLAARATAAIPALAALLFAVKCESAFAAGDGPARVTVYADEPTGPVKPVNGVGQPPMVGAPTSFAMMPRLKAAGIPYARLHDVGGPYGQLRYVDVPNLFRDFAADETRPESYSFAYTDALMKALVQNGVEPFFRLGVTIDNPVVAGYPGYFLDPPKDPAKWARVCERIIRHYTEGWADGFRMKVTYWEIWNEPDNSPDPEKNPMWHGTFAEYVRFYGVVASHLKAKFPHLKIGGYGSCGFYAGVGAARAAAGNSSPRLEHFIDCATNFLASARANGWPLDFFSYHSYSKPSEALEQVRYADRLLTAYGFSRQKTERVFNEWLPYAERKHLGTAKSAAAIAATLVGLQNGPCDLACIYDARCGIGDYSPLFNPMTYAPHKAWQAFMAFNELRKRGQAVRADAPSGFPALHVAAAADAAGATALLVNDGDAVLPVEVAAPGLAFAGAAVTDADRTAAPLARVTALPPQSVVLMRFSRQGNPPSGRNAHSRETQARDRR